jgi:glycolate oxidase
VTSSPLIERLAAIVGPRRVLERRSELLAYSSDGLPGYTKIPNLAIFPGSRDEVVAVIRELARDNVPFVPRGAGTGLSGGALAEGMALLCLNRLKRIISIDVANQLAVVEPGVVNSVLSREVAQHGLHYAPDPSSQAACTIGGNVAENAGGPHCLKYGVTLNHVVAVTAVLPDATVHTFGNAISSGPSSGRKDVSASRSTSPSNCSATRRRCERFWQTSRRSMPQLVPCPRSSRVAFCPPRWK